MNSDPATQNPEDPSGDRHSPDTRNDGSVERTLGSIGSDFIVIGKRRVHSWYAWIVIGIAVGITVAVILVADRSGEFSPSEAEVGVIEDDSTLPPENVGDYEDNTPIRTSSKKITFPLKEGEDILP